MRATGPGKGKALSVGGGFLIYNFDVDGPALKPEHRTFLTQNVVDTLKAGGTLAMQGVTDRTGSSGHNETLSRQRVENALTFLRQAAGSSFTVVPPVASGESAAALAGEADGTEDEAFRGVMLFVDKAQPNVEPTVKPRTQDIYIRLSGYDRPEQAGADMSDTPPAKALRDALDSTPGYLERHRTLRTIWFVGGEGTGDKTDEIVKQVNAEQQKAQLGRVVISGGSSGGRVALSVASKLTTGLAKAPVVFIGIADGAFQKSDLVDPNQDPMNNPLKFKCPSLICSEKVNLYQSWGHTLDPNQELHGEIQGFTTNTDLFTPGSAVDGIRITYENNLISFNVRKQAALEAAHISAYSEAFAKYDQRAVQIFKALT